MRIKCTKLFMLIVILLGYYPCTSSLASNLQITGNEMSILGETWFGNSIEQIDMALINASYIFDDEYEPLLSYKNPYAQPYHILVEPDKDNAVRKVNLFYSDKNKMEHISQLINNLSGLSIQKQSSIENQLTSHYNEYQYTITPFDIINLSEGHMCKDFVLSLEKIKPCTIIASYGNNSLLIENICMKYGTLSFMITNNSPDIIERVYGEVLVYKNTEVIQTTTWGTWTQCAFQESTYDVNVSDVPSNATYVEIRITDYSASNSSLSQPDPQITYVCELN